MNATWTDEATTFKCPNCPWTGPAIELDGAGENECPDCGGKCKAEN